MKHFIIILLFPFTLLGQDNRGIRDYERTIWGMGFGVKGTYEVELDESLVYELDTIYADPLNQRITKVEFDRDLVYVYYEGEEMTMYGMEIDIKKVEFRKVYRSIDGEFQHINTEFPEAIPVEEIKYVNKYTQKY